MKLTTPFSPSIAFLSVAASLGVATILSSAAPASAISGPVTLGFVCDDVANGTTNSGPGAISSGCLTGAAQFKAVVSPVGTTQALFTFSNLGPAASSITDIDIFDTFPALAGLTLPQPSNPGVNFFTGSAGGGQYFSFSLGNTAQSVTNGINPLDNLSILFNIAPGFNKPFNAVAASLFQKGITVQLQASGFNPVTNPAVVNFKSQVQAVPEPITMLGSAAALGFGALMKRRSSQLKSKKGLGTPVPATCETLA